jgi:hypothetical protein
VFGANLPGTLDFDLQENVLAVRIGQRRAVEVAMEIGPLEETVLVNGALKGRAIDEMIFGAILISASGPGSPTAAQPQPFVVFDERTGNGSFTYAAGTNENDN